MSLKKIMFRKIFNNYKCETFYNLSQSKIDYYLGSIRLPTTIVSRFGLPEIYTPYIFEWR